MGAKIGMMRVDEKIKGGKVFIQNV